MLFIHTQPPHGSINAQEGLDALMMGSAFATCTSLYVDDGVYQLCKNQNTEALGQKNFSKTFGALKDYGVTQICVCQLSLTERGLSPDDLLLEVEVVDNESIRHLLVAHSKVLTF